MSHAKDLEIQEWAQRWKFSPGSYVCHRCLTDRELADYVKSNATDFQCDFCFRVTKKHPSSIEFDSLMEVIGETFNQYYERAVEQMGWDSEEGGYVGTTYDAYDIFRDEFGGITENEKLLQAMINAFSDEIWCERDPYAITGFDAYEMSWEHFCAAVKHKTRYFFTRRDNSGSPNSDLTPVSEMLDELSSHLESEDLIISLDQSSMFVRVRTHGRGELCKDWKSLGSPPPAVAPSNRMSAAGISMFYCSTTKATAKAEALSTLRDKNSAALTAAAWSPSRPLLLLNLFDIPKTPSLWFSYRPDRDRVLFLKAFAESISEPVNHDGREHIDYVPSQIVTEYFRHVYRTKDGKQIDGIIFPSARVRKGRNVVIFASSDDLRPTVERPSSGTPLLMLDPSSIKRLRLHK